MSKKISRIIGVCMLLVAIVFVAYALTHPEASPPFGLDGSIARPIYVVYLLAMIVFWVAPFKKKS